MRGENMGVYPVSNLKEIRKNKYPSMTDFWKKQMCLEKLWKEQKVDIREYQRTL